MTIYHQLQIRAAWLGWLLIGGGVVALAGATNEPLPAIRSAGAVRELALEQAQRQLPVRLLGVVTYHEPWASLTFVQDDSAGIYVALDRRVRSLRAGDWVEIPDQQTLCYRTPNNSSLGGSGSQRPVNRHSRRYNVAYADGHTEVVPVSRLQLQYYPGAGPGGQPATGNPLYGGNGFYDDRWQWDTR